ncbi:MAG: phospholipase D-like domain-containing protein [Gammaproteobacteria bacterium]|nr:phospholipase D-like domain-containing protein [Gammaproteobacteria bacterium]
MLQAIDSAQRYILLEMYLIESGAVAERFIDAMLDAAERGVRIYLLFDDFGALGLKQGDREHLRHRNIHTVYYNPLASYSRLYNLYKILWRHIYRGLHRDHRKLLLVDGKVAFAGGTGVVDEFDPPAHPEKRWRETMVEIHGPVLKDWQLLFLEAWNKHARDTLDLPRLEVDETSNGQQGRVTVNEMYRWRGMQRSLNRHIKRAEHRVWLATAYFVPSWNLRRALKQAARKGVDVRILLPGPITDHPGARHAGRRYYRRLLNNGARIFEYQPRFLHAKTVLCDNWVAIGSTNYDRWNLQWNLEANQEIHDHDLAVRVRQVFEQDFAHCREYTYEDWRHRSWRLRMMEWFWRRIELLSLTLKDRRKK